MLDVRKKKDIVLAVFMLLVVCAAPSGCIVSKSTPPAEEKPLNVLRVGISPDYPPLIFKMDGKIAGVEADLARLLAQTMSRPLQFVEMRWEDLIPGLMEGKIDIIMSGMSVTKPRTIRIVFAAPYFRTRIVTAMRAGELGDYDSLEEIVHTMGNVGVLPGTTADAFVQRNFPKARRVVIAKAEYAAQELKTRKIDLFVADGPAVAWLVSRNEAGVAAFWQPLAEEDLAWGVRRDDSALLEEVNGVLAGWKQDGTLQKVLVRWLPYLEKIQ